jgi:hypothetical protein
VIEEEDGGSDMGTGKEPEEASRGDGEQEGTDEDGGGRREAIGWRT